MRLGGDWEAMAPGIERKLSSLGEKLMSVTLRLQAGSSVPEHSHPHEQVTVVLSGRVRFTIAGAQREYGAGEAASIRGGLPHSLATLEDSLVVDVFTPLREDLLDPGAGV